ncbi:TauD/TfdA family dioxygenase [Streptomyces triculaminicus]|uniref:TauD/TfdA family dioxygenase n=1 Tax=Streptomyces triculaminicus TaxID=2816232 RepID=A0A939JJW1_9ACTN|nr:TauD/TfdA family dioxygenase [Streptomyces triculaminicus]MBO0651401.1 TauD/TfdA family dioxygenase [Streptomyces triculaminicus]
MTDAPDVPAAGRYDVTPVEPFGVAILAPEPGARVADLDVTTLRALVRAHHILLLRGFAPFGGPEELSAYCELWGEPSVWPFGTVLELVEKERPEDHIFDHSHMPMHWDGMYRDHIPEFQIFQCVHAPGADDGGETTFSHTTAVLEHADPGTVARWSRMTGTYHRAMEYYDSVTVSPVVTAHPVHGAPVVRYNEPVAPGDGDFVNHPDLRFTGLPDDELAEAHRTLRAALHDPAHLYVHSWRTGDVVISDNYTLLHGRNAFTSGAPRHLRRVQVLGTPPLVNPGLVR